MGKIAFLFPGQGAQRVGMGQELADHDAALRGVFDEADQALGFSLSQTMFEGPEDQLTLTENTQPALLTTAMAAYRMVEMALDRRPDYVAGHSLGEYAAICAAGGLSFSDAVRLVRRRGQAMQAAVPVGVGAMAAMLNMSQEAVEAACRAGVESAGGVCAPANFNTSAQIVISGHKAAVEAAITYAKAQGARRCVPLPVSAPFHCPLMEPAAQAMAEALAETPPKDLTIPLVANVTATETTQGAEVRDLLVRQVTGAVLWEASIQRLMALGVTLFVEVGTGSALTGMMRRIDRKAAAIAVNGPGDLEALKARLG